MNKSDQMDQVEHVRQTVGLVEANRVETSDFEETESGSTGKEVVGGSSSGSKVFRIGQGKLVLKMEGKRARS